MPVYGSEQRCPRGWRLRGGQFKETGVADRSKVLVGGAWKGCRRTCRAASHGRSRRIGQVSRPGSCSADRGTNRRFWSRMPLNGKNYVARVQGLEHLARQSVLASAFALMRPDGGIKRRTGGQTDHHHQSRQRKSHTSSLRAGLGIHGLVLGGIGAWSDRCHRSASPLDRATAIWDSPCG